ncbi:MAG: hypothetical protein F9K23_17000 [Bacteroidetes bacterium]|nr:MAG: hypothetical protein F9K23_17000 [Bacteroidota bacterium]
MKKLYILLLWFIPTTLLFNACDGGEPVPPPPTNQWPKDWYIPQEVLDYFYFKQGSYWIFQNDKTGEIDSVVVSVNKKQMTTPSSQGESYEVVECYTVSFFDGYTYKYAMSTQGSAGCIKEGSKWPCYGLSCYKYKVGNVLGESISWDYPFTKGYGGVADFSGQNSQYVLQDMYDTLFTFPKVIKVNITKSLIFNRKNINLFWAKDVGIIKKENLTDNETWNLIRYHIIK